MPLDRQTIDLEWVLSNVGEAGWRVATQKIATRADRLVASFACALVLWMLERNPRRVWRDGEAFLAEVERERETLQ